MASLRQHPVPPTDLTTRARRVDQTHPGQLRVDLLVTIAALLGHGPDLVHLTDRLVAGGH
jgi:hypothetical protein